MAAGPVVRKLERRGGGSEATSAALLRRLLREHVAGQATRLAFAGAMMAVVAGATAAQAWMMQPVLDRVFLERDGTMLLLVPLAVVAIALVKGLADYAQNVSMAHVGQRIVADVQRRVFGHLMRADLGYVVGRGPGGLVSNLTYDAGQLRAALSSVLTGVAKDSVTVLFLLALMFHQDWRLASVAFVVFPAALFPIVRLGRLVRKAARRGQAQMGRLTGRLQEAFGGIRQVKADGREGDEAARTGHLIEEQYRINLKVARVSSATSPIMEALGGVTVAAVIFYGGSRVLAGATTPGTFFSFITALLLAYQPVKSLAKLNARLQQGLAAAQRLYAVLDREPVIRDRPGAAPLRVTAGRIRLDGVHFTYDGERPALHGFSLDVPPGMSVALVGPSGGGKSTALNLILRFYEPSSGRVLIDDQDVRDVTVESLRASIALVSQDVTLFNDTVRANIAYGRPEASDAEVEAAARAAAAHGFITALPQGYDTVLGAMGGGLSGGQRQRLSIARAMLKDAPILLLDEATSNLDAEAERHVQSALARLVKGRTTLMIAHRLSTIAAADLIAVVAGGRVVETGNHASLLARGGTYARLHRLQFAGEQRHSA